MVLGLSLQAFTALHVAISLIGIFTGLIAMVALARGYWLRTWQIAFLASTAATSITGFLFPFSGVTPALLTGLISMAVLAVATGALIASPIWGRAIYAVSATIALYLNLFVLVVQSFLKIPALHLLAPAGTEFPFLAAQSIVLVASVVLGAMAVGNTRRIAL